MEQRIQGDAEVGMVLIPIESALSCCYESEKDILTYCAWYPLSSPQDYVHKEGDMGLSKRPEEAENESSHSFNNPYQPCIKIVFFWRPEITESTLHKDDVPYTDSPLASSNESLLTNSLDYFYGSVGIWSCVLVDSYSPRELLSFYLTDLDVRYSISNKRTRLALTIGDLQLDNQLENALEPVIIFPTPTINPLPTIQLFVVRNDARSKINVHSFEHMEFALQELDIKIEDVWLLNIWTFLEDVITRRINQSKILPPEKNEVIYASFIDSDIKAKSVQREVPLHDSFFNSSFESTNSTTFTSDNQRLAKKLYIQHLILGSIKLNLSYYNTIKGLKKKSSEQSDISGPVAFKSNPKNDQLSSDDLFQRWSESSYDDWNYAKEPQNVTFVSAIFPSITDFPIRK